MSLMVGIAQLPTACVRVIKDLASYVQFEVLTAVSMKIAMSTHRPDDGGSKDLWNVGKLLPDYTVLQPRRQAIVSYVHFIQRMCLYV
jgi:hypothetical protein